MKNNIHFILIIIFIVSPAGFSAFAQGSSMAGGSTSIQWDDVTRVNTTAYLASGSREDDGETNIKHETITEDYSSVSLSNNFQKKDGDVNRDENEKTVEFGQEDPLEKFTGGVVFGTQSIYNKRYNVVTDVDETVKRVKEDRSSSGFRIYTPEATWGLKFSIDSFRRTSTNNYYEQDVAKVKDDSYYETYKESIELIAAAFFLDSMYIGTTRKCELKRKQSIDLPDDASGDNNLDYEGTFTGRCYNYGMGVYKEFFNLSGYFNYGVEVARFDEDDIKANLTYNNTVQSYKSGDAQSKTIDYSIGLGMAFEFGRFGVSLNNVAENETITFLDNSLNKLVHEDRTERVKTSSFGFSFNYEAYNWGVRVAKSKTEIDVTGKYKNYRESNSEVLQSTFYAIGFSHTDSDRFIGNAGMDFVYGITDVDKEIQRYLKSSNEQPSDSYKDQYKVYGVSAHFMW